MRLQITTCVLAIGALSLASTAFADDSEDLLTPYGMSFTVGGSFSDFVRPAVNDFTEPGGGWEARYVIGTRKHIAGEAAYTASLNGLEALGMDENALLLGNGGEVALRANITTSALQPYVIAGVGWRHYDVTNTDKNTSDVADTDDAMTIPVNVGISYRYERFVSDLRATYRPSFFDDISATSNIPLDSASVGLNVGFEF